MPSLLYQDIMRHLFLAIAFTRAAKACCRLPPATTAGQAAPDAVLAKGTKLVQPTCGDAERHSSNRVAELTYMQYAELIADGTAR